MSSRESRRGVLALAAGALAASALPPGAGAKPQTPTLASAASSRHLVYGVAGGSELVSDTAYRRLLIEQSVLLTPDNALKFDALQPERGRFNFGLADTLVDGARRAGLQVHGHTLIWNDWPPAWLKTLTRREARRVFDAYLDNVVPHFAGRLVSWDVVNEPFYLGLDRPGTYRPGVWYDAFGPDYITRAFHRTAELDRNAKLVLNEAWTERADPVGLAVRRSLLRLIDEMQHDGLRLDAIGLQSHLTPQIAYDDAGFADFLHEIARRGLDIYLSEFDVDDHGYPGDIAARDAAVAARTRAYLDTALAVPAVKRVVTWGLSDRYSWWRDPAVMHYYDLTKLPRPLPYDDQFRGKPMRTAMIEAFEHRAGATPPG